MNLVGVQGLAHHIITNPKTTSTLKETANAMMVTSVAGDLLKGHPDEFMKMQATIIDLQQSDINGAIKVTEEIHKVLKSDFRNQTGNLVDFVKNRLDEFVGGLKKF